MSYEFKLKRMEKAPVSEFVAKETVSEIAIYPFVENKERNVTKETCMKFGVRAALSEKDGKTPVAYYFPSYNQKGEIVGYTKQDVTKNKDEKWHWSAVGTVAIGNKLFGQNVAEQVNRKHTNCVYTEGQWDCLSVFQAQVDSVKGTKYEGHQPFVTSIPLGTKNAVEAMLHNKEFVNSFDSMTIFFDSDEATPAESKKGILRGKEATEAVASAFIGDVELWCVQPSTGFKDASDYMQAGKSSELAKLVQFGRKPLVTEKIAQVDSISFDELIAPMPKGVDIECFPKLNDMMYGIRKGELTVVTSHAGAGKTTCLTKVAENLVSIGERIGLIYLEEQNKQTLQRFVSSSLGVSYKKFKRNPLSVATQQEVKDVYDRFVQDRMLVMLDHFGSMSINTLMQKVKHMYFVEGVKYIFLDHLSMVISGSAITDERKELDIVMTELASFCAANDVAIFLVVHLNRNGSNDIRPPKGKEDEPFWVRVTKEHIRGSASIEQIAWNVLGIEQEIMPDRSRGRARWVFLKNREGGALGIADVFSLNEDDWSVILYEDEDFKPTAPTQKQSVTIKPMCLEEDVDLRF